MKENLSRWAAGPLGLVVALLVVLLPRTTGETLLVAWAVICSIGMGIAGLRMRNRAARVIYTQLGVIGLLMIVGIIIRAIHGEQIGEELPFPSPADLLHVPAYLLFVGVAWRVHIARSNGRNTPAWLDAGAIAFAMLAIVWGGFLGDYVFDPSIDLGERALSVTYNVLLLSAVAIVVRTMASPASRPTSYYLLGGSLFAFLITDLSGTFGLAQGDTFFIGTALSPIVFGLVFAASVHPTAEEIADPTPLHEERIGIPRFVVTALALVTPPFVAALAQPERWQTRVAFFLLSVSLAILVTLRVTRLLAEQRDTNQLDRLLSQELASLTTADSVDEIRSRLTDGATRLLPMGNGCRLVPSAPEGHPSDAIELPANLASDEMKVLVVDSSQPLAPARVRVLDTFVRDAGLIGASVEGIAATAKQDSEREANERIAASERRFRALVQHSNDVVIVMDEAGRVKFATDSTERTLGYDVQDLMDSPLSKVLHEKDRPAAERFFFSVVDGAAHQRRYEFRCVTAQGEVRLFESIVTDMRHVEGIEGFVLNAADVTDRHRLERDLKDAETIDPLTMQYNRKAFLDEVDIANRRASVTGDPIAVAIVDLDDFKTINDALGPVHADRTLIEVAHRIRQSVGVGDVIARLSGDEFGVLLTDVDSDLGAVAEIERILRELNAPMTIADFTITVKATSGLFVDASGLEDSIGFLKNADTALTVAKTTNRGSVVLFEDTMAEAVEQRLDLRTTLEIALDTRGLRLAYQPIVDTVTGEIVSLEALARWTHPERGEISPGVFIPIAESSGLISKLGDWALKTACKQVVEWDEHGYNFFTVSVNVSGHQLREDDYLQRVRAILLATGVDPGRIIIEITESVLIDDTDFIAHRIRSLRELGLALAIDDFGTGYSSLSYLQRYEFDYLKIDRGFVRPLGRPDHEQEKEIVSAIVSLAQGLGAITVAEGIEEIEEMAALEALRCDRLQGFLFYRPMEVEAVRAALDSSLDEAQAA